MRLGKGGDDGAMELDSDSDSQTQVVGAVLMIGRWVVTSLMLLLLLLLLLLGGAAVRVNRRSGLELRGQAFRPVIHLRV